MKQSFFQSVIHACHGVLYVAKNERNMKIHLFVLVCVLITGIILNISYFEWIICFILFALILSLEILNTAIEATIDLITEEIHPLAKIAKDCSAGAVFISAIFAAMIGLMIFVPKLLFYIKLFF